MDLIDLSKLSENIVGLVDIIGRLAESIEKAIKSGVRSGDVFRRARERKRLRNLLLLTAHLYRTQGGFVSSLRYFEDVGSWETAKFEILEIRRFLDQIEKYVLPYNDVLVRSHRKQYLELLAALDERRKLLDFVYNLDYKEAEKNRKKLEAVASAYEKLMNRLQALAFEFGSIGSEDPELWDDVTSAKKLESLDEPAESRHRPKSKLGSSKTKSKRRPAPR